MITGFVAIIKFLFSLKDEINDLKIVVTKLDAKLDAKSDLFDNKITNINKQIEQVKETQTEQTAITNTKINKIEDELKEQRTENTQLINKVLDVFKEPKAVAI
jgi:septal ring factor EnvC (AmiA/AmiB activator)